MAEILHFEDDLASLNREELRSRLETVHLRIAELDAQEPEDMESEEYEVWGDRHEELEDMADELMERLDEMEE